MSASGLLPEHSLLRNPVIWIILKLQGETTRAPRQYWNKGDSRRISARKRTGRGKSVKYKYMGKDKEQIFRVIKKHYLMRMSQKDIARSEGLSTATVSRIIAGAVDKGYVEFTLKFPGGNVVEMEHKIQELFGLKFVSVTKVDLDDLDIILRDISICVGDYLNYIVRDGDILGVAWGYTMSKVANGLKPHNIKDGKIVGINGGLIQNNTSIGAEDIIEKFSRNFNAAGYRLMVPVSVDSAEAARMLKKDSHLKQVFDLIHQANIVVFGLGGMALDSTMVRYGGFTESEFEKLKSDGYVGDIGGRFFREDGSPGDNGFNERIMGIELEEIKQKDYRIAVVASETKAEALYAALKNGYITSLFLDEKTARRLIEVEYSCREEK